MNVKRRKKDIVQYFFFELGFVGSVGLFKLSIRSSIDFAFFVAESFIVVIDAVGVKLDARVFRAEKYQIK